MPESWISLKSSKSFLALLLGVHLIAFLGLWVLYPSLLIKLILSPLVVVSAAWGYCRTQPFLGLKHLSHNKWLALLKDGRRVVISPTRHTHLGYFFCVVVAKVDSQKHSAVQWVFRSEVGHKRFRELTRQLRIYS